MIRQQMQILEITRAVRTRDAESPKFLCSNWPKPWRSSPYWTVLASSCTYNVLYLATLLFSTARHVIRYNKSEARTLVCSGSNQTWQIMWSFGLSWTPLICYVEFLSIYWACSRSLGFERSLVQNEISHWRSENLHKFTLCVRYVQSPNPNCKGQAHTHETCIIFDSLPTWLTKSDSKSANGHKLTAHVKSPWLMDGTTTRDGRISKLYIHQIPANTLLFAEYLAVKNET